MSLWSKEEIKVNREIPVVNANNATMKRERLEEKEGENKKGSGQQRCSECCIIKILICLKPTTVEL